MSTVRLIFILSLIGSSFQIHLGALFDKFVSEIVKDLPQNITLHDDYGLDIYAYLNKYGYPIETHHVTTEDGYILGVHRIPHGRADTNVLRTTMKPTVILQHGLLSCSMDWVNRGPGRSLGLMLADAGWDVWLGNNRGNTYSRNHTSLNPDTDSEFWDYSFEECGRFDVPAMIDYIRKETGQNKVFYVGHSQGTTQFFAMGALRPEYNDKIILMTALAPVTYVKHISSPPMRWFAKNIDILMSLADAFKIHELLPHQQGTADLAKQFCSDGSEYHDVCAIVLYLMCGFSSAQMDKSFLPMLASNDPAGISIKMLAHFLQEVNSVKKFVRDPLLLTGTKIETKIAYLNYRFFRRYDLGEMGNLQKYKVSTPPNYNVSAITAPIALYYSKNDLLTAVVDVERFASELPNVRKLHLMELKYFNHLDFMIAKDLAELLNNDLINFMESYIDDNDQGDGGIVNNHGVVFLTSIISTIILNMLVN